MPNRGGAFNRMKKAKFCAHQTARGMLCIKKSYSNSRRGGVGRGRGSSLLVTMAPSAALVPTESKGAALHMPHGNLLGLGQDQATPQVPSRDGRGSDPSRMLPADHNASHPPMLHFRKQAALRSRLRCGFPLRWTPGKLLSGLSGYSRWTSATPTAEEAGSSLEVDPSVDTEVKIPSALDDSEEAESELKLKSSSSSTDDNRTPAVQNLRSRARLMFLFSAAKRIAWTYIQRHRSSWQLIAQASQLWVSSNF